MFPLGVTSYIFGGLVIGIGVSFVYIFTGQHATQSSLLSSTLSYFSNLTYFQKKTYLESREWRIYFALGVILGAFIYTISISPDGFWRTSVQWWRLLLGGFLIGFGTRLSSGCTSGHGISGVASLSTTSLFAVITFILFGIITANIMLMLGVSP